LPLSRKFDGKCCAFPDNAVTPDFSFMGVDDIATNMETKSCAGGVFFTASSAPESFEEKSQIFLWHTSSGA